ncbi:MAG: hypothetical protein L0215_14890 [Gemmataceae bacterium]|nr:hypothetical protein [Gemmataceae bacterium]
MKRLSLGIVFTAVLATASWAVSARALCCPFCSEERGPTLVGDFAQAAMVMVGTFGNAKFDGSLEGGTTDFQIETVLKTHEIIKGKKTITLPRYIAQTKNKFLVFCDVYKGMIDPYRGVELQPGSDLVKYLSGAVGVKDKSPAERLRYCFDFLNSADFETAIDAYREYAKADYADYKDMAKKLPPDVIAGWLRDEKTAPYRYGLYASLLGHCGGEEHAKLLRSMIDDPEKRKGSGIDGLLAAYVMLKPKEAWGYIQGLVKDDKEEFLMRYAALRTMRFLWDQRPDLVSKEELVKGMTLILDQPDMSDFGIEDLRKWKRWEQTDRILDIFGKKTHDIPVVRRAVLRFALQSPQTRAAAFVKQQRTRDADWVKDTEELLKLEDDVQAPPPPKTK